MAPWPHRLCCGGDEEHKGNCLACLKTWPCDAEEWRRRAERFLALLQERAHDHICSAIPYYDCDGVYHPARACDCKLRELIAEAT